MESQVVEVLEASSIGNSTKWAFVMGCLSPVALFATPVGGPILGIASLIVGMVASRQGVSRLERSMIVTGAALSVVSIVLSWLSPGFMHILWS